jgi:hypothetical protein
MGDFLYGGRGRDLLHGGRGDDHLVGGSLRSQANGGWSFADDEIGDTFFPGRDDDNCLIGLNDWGHDCEVSSGY